MSESDEILAIPLWINGHAYLTMAPAFFDVCAPRSGHLVRRTPLCGASQARVAVEAAASALPGWVAWPLAERAARLVVLADALAGYAAHFADLIAEETGQPATSAAAEVAAALQVLRGAADSAEASAGSVVVGLVCDDRTPLLGLLQRAVPALRAGATLVIKPSPQAPSVAVALAELTAQCGFPDGVCNVLHGDLAAIDGLCASAEVKLLLFAGDPLLAARVAVIATRHGKPFVD